MAAQLHQPVRPITQRASRAMVVDDHPIVVDAMVTALLGMQLFERVESANSLAQACHALEDDARCALAILDLHLGQAEARETLLGFRERFPDVPVMVFTGDDSLESITMAFECGARGYATKSSPMQTVHSAIRIVLSGGSYIPPEAMRGLGFSPAPVTNSAAPAPSEMRLSGRQTQVFHLLLQGMPNKVIGARLVMAEGTVKAHMNSIFRALGVRTRVEAILRARQMGLV